MGNVPLPPDQTSDVPQSEPTKPLKDPPLESVKTPPEKKPERNKLLLIGFSVLFILITGTIYFRGIQKMKNAMEPGSYSPETLPSPTPTGDETNWKTYFDSQTNLAFQYPTSVILTDTNNIPDDTLSITITVEAINVLNMGTLGYDRETSLQDIESLIKGEYGNLVDFAVPESQEVISVQNVNGKSFMVLGRFDVCDIIFERRLILYTSTHRVILTLYGPKETIMKESADFFIRESEGSGPQCWDYQNDAQGRFFQSLKAKQGSPTTQNWYDTFELILSTFKFTSSQSDESLFEVPNLTSDLNWKAIPENQ